MSGLKIEAEYREKPGGNYICHATLMLTNEQLCFEFEIFARFQPRISEKRNEGHYVELPLHELRQKYSSPEGAAFLQNEIVAKQPGRPHPQVRWKY